MSTENTSSKIDQLTNNVFSVLLIVLFIGCIVSFFISIFSGDDPNYATSSFSTAGAAGSAILYMKWDVIRRTRIKESSVSEVGDLLNKTASKNE